jgi:hypothetical protein
VGWTAAFFRDLSKVGLILGVLRSSHGRAPDHSPGCQCDLENPLDMRIDHMKLVVIPPQGLSGVPLGPLGSRSGGFFFLGIARWRNG